MSGQGNTSRRLSVEKLPSAYPARRKTSSVRSNIFPFDKAIVSMVSTSLGRSRTFFVTGDRRTQPAQFFFHPLIPTIQMVHAENLRLTFRRKPSQDQSGARTKIGRHHRSPGQSGRSSHPRPTALDLALRNPPAQLLAMHEATFENRLRNHTRALSSCHQGPHLRLHVG